MPRTKGPNGVGLAAIVTGYETMAVTVVVAVVVAVLIKSRC